MGALTRADIVREGQLLAQRTDMGTLAAGWLQRWLDAVAASWPWPVLQRESTNLSISNGSITVGDGNGGVTERINRINDNTWVWDTSSYAMQRVRILEQTNQPSDRITRPGASLGTPQKMRLFQSQVGRWTLYFDPNPDKTYGLSLAYWAIPAAMTQDSDVPWYPNDETMVQAVAFKVHEYNDGKEDPRTIAAQQLLSGALANDRIRYGSVTGINNTIQLDPARFTRSKAP